MIRPSFFCNDLLQCDYPQRNAYRCHILRYSVFCFDCLLLQPHAKVALFVVLFVSVYTCLFLSSHTRTSNTIQRKTNLRSCLFRQLLPIPFVFVFRVLTTLDSSNISDFLFTLAFLAYTEIDRQLNKQNMPSNFLKSNCMGWECLSFQDKWFYCGYL